MMQDTMPPHATERPASLAPVERRVMRPVEPLRTVAALYVQPNGCYVGVPGVDPWDEARDARKYAGQHPVVAHPPCSRWSRLAKFCEARHGLKVGDDGGCFEAALHAVRTWGGVIEHPAFTMAWARYGLPRPDTKAKHWTPGICGGFSCYVEQGRYGHAVKKATWLYVFGVPLRDLPELRWGHTPDNRGTIAKNQDWRGGMDKWRDSTGHRLANATPPAFRDLLLDLARKAHNAEFCGGPLAGSNDQGGLGPSEETGGYAA